MGYEEIIYSKEHFKATITLNRPEKLNAYGEKMGHELKSAVADIETDDNVKVVIITGAGRGFCSGHDLKDTQSTVRSNTRRLFLRFDRDEYYLPTHVYGINKPVIGAVNGVTAGGGVALALACDFRIASKEVMFFENHVGIGTLPGLETLLLPRIVGLEKALEIIFTGKKITAEEALNIGLVSKIVPREKLMEEANELADRIANSPLWSLMLSKKAVYQGLQITSDQTIDYITLARAICSQAGITNTTLPKKSGK